MAAQVPDLHRLAREGQTNLLLIALEPNPAQLLTLDADKRTPLQNAISAVPPNATLISSILDLLPKLELEEKVKLLESKDETGATALISAASVGNVEILRLLVSAGADVTATNDKGITPLHYAASKGHVAVGRLLIDNGADINARDKANQIPMHRAATTGALPFLQLLLASQSPNRPHAPRLNQQDRAGNTPLHLAIESGHAEIAVALIEAGCDRERTDMDGVRAEEIDGVGGQEAKRVREFIVQRCGPLDPK